MQILFTRSNTILSKTICAITKEPVSHCALKVGPFVIHSNLLGVRIVPYNVFASSHEIVYNINKIELNESIKTVLKECYGKPYDIGALIYLGLRFLFPQLMPKQNLWQTTGMFLCTEFITKMIDMKEDSLITPYKLYLKLTEKKVK